MGNFAIWPFFVAAALAGIAGWKLLGWLWTLVRPLIHAWTA